VKNPHLLTIIWALIILILCGMPGKDVPDIGIFQFDKLVHAAIFFVLVTFAIRGFRLQTKNNYLRKNSAFLAVGLSIAYGGILEILQGTIFSERSADFYDFIANSFGCFIALLLYPKISKRFPKLNMPL
jgi:succinate-acetate transporter protein